MDYSRVYDNDIDKEALLDELGALWVRASRSGTGPDLGLDRYPLGDQVRYLKGVVMSRMDQVEPPVAIGQQVRPKAATVKTSARNAFEARRKERNLPGVLRVRRAYYWPDGTWSYVFDEETRATTYSVSDYSRDGCGEHRIPLHFDSVDFEPAPADAVAA